MGLLGRHSTESGRLRSWTVCAVLAASLWRAPVPWIHSHETLEAEGLPEAALAWHLHHLHPHEAENAIFGWHLHLSYPWDVSNEPSPPADPKAPKPRAVYDMPYVVSQASGVSDVDRPTSSWLAAMLVFAHAAAGSTQLNAECVCGRHFQPAFSSSVSLRALICIARC